MDLFASVHPKLPVCHSEAFDMLRLNSAKKPPLCHPERSEGSPRFFVVPPLAGLLRMTFQIVIHSRFNASAASFSLSV
jgi:hypothetical protein